MGNLEFSLDDVTSRRKKILGKKKKLGGGKTLNFKSKGIKKAGKNVVKTGVKGAIRRKQQGGKARKTLGGAKKNVVHRRK